VEGDFAYIASSSSIAVLDISDPASPRIAMVKPLPSEMSEIMQRGVATNARIFNGHLYLCYGMRMYDGAVAIFECSEPNLLTYCGKVDTQCHATSIDFYDQYAFVASHETIEVFYVSDTGELCRVAILPGYWDTSDLLIKNTHLYLADFSGLHILGIAAPPRITRQTINGNMLSLEWNEAAEGMRLQRATSLSNPNWQELLGSETTNAVSLPIWSGTQFFRLIKP
jgi:hypothetical protein